MESKEDCLVRNIRDVAAPNITGGQSRAKEHLTVDKKAQQPLWRGPITSPIGQRDTIQTHRIVNEQNGENARLRGGDELALQRD